MHDEKKEAHLITLTRKEGESIMIGDDIKIKVKEYRGNQVRLSIYTDKFIPIHRQEIYDRIQEEKETTNV